MDSKRGQEGMSIGTLLLIILGIVVLVILILGFTMGFGYIFDKIGLLPGQSLETVAQSCAVSVQGGLLVDFCSFKEVKVDGKKQYVNCLDSRLSASIIERLKDTDKTMPGAKECNIEDDSSEVSFCKGKRKADEFGDMKKIIVNGQSCEGIGVVTKVKP